MPLEYIQPRVAVDESDVGPRPTPAVSLSDIGVVGTFSKGVVNTPVTVGSVDQLVSYFGGYVSGLTGYPAVLAALAQGANSFKVVRIGGASIDSAAHTFKDASNADSVVVTAKTPGSWGNSITGAVASGTTGGTFKLIITYGVQQETFDNLTLDDVATKVVSQFVTAAKAAAATAIPANILATPLSGGDDGATTEDADYVGTIDGNGNRFGLKVLETVRCGIVICAGQYSTTIRNALLTHCANLGLASGLRVAVLNTDRGLSPDQAVASVGAMDSMRGVLAYPWVELSDLAGVMIPPDGVYAGRLATLGGHESPSNKQIAGINSTERYLAEADIKALTQARISPIALDGNRGFRIRNGVTLSSDSAWSQTNIRRIFDELEMEIYEATQWAKSENNTPKLRKAIADQIDNYLVVKKQQEKIYDFKPTICDETNNTPETIQARILNSRIRIRPNYAADYIDHRIQRLVGNESS
ncbi:phage tail sheath C-terminal domain-containing protein [Pelotomaculum propionicicum]|uniref:Putative prophage major tail sheath protein n=1 Tax=Pelotomaculum propionicicum TaxID=258475 RepID=A0A4Y7RJZ4_9FIRM|nr:phage tail sheath C-terminal domain-containing protein [Pelotomaculum propionicicum]TEB09305.1 putative prophage major tail sheath protein [Pelotomaculum propionicicum]